MTKTKVRRGMDEDGNPLPYSKNKLIRMIQDTKDILNAVVVIRLKWLLLGMLVFLASVILTQVQFNDRDNQKRASDKYINDLVDYHFSRVIRDDCVDRVERSDLNRAQHQAIVDLLTALGYKDYAAILENGPLLGSKPFTIDDCPQVLPKPVPPNKEAEEEGNNLPPLVPTTTG